MSGDARANCMLVLIPSERQRGHPEGHPEGSRPVCQRVCLTTPAPACEGWERISLLSGSAHTQTHAHTHTHTHTHTNTNTHTHTHKHKHTHTHTHTWFGFSVRRFDGWSRSTCSPICQCTSLQYYWHKLSVHKPVQISTCSLWGLAQKASSGVPNW